MGDRPPSREEVMFEWFVGDAKDILQEATALREELTTLRQQHQEDSAAQVAALRDQHQALIAAQREVVRAVKDGSQSIEHASRQAAQDAQAVSARMSRRVAGVALLSAALGAAIGAAGILALFLSLGFFP